MNMLTGRQIMAATPVGLGGAAERYRAATARIGCGWPLQGISGATLLPSRHNRPCWKRAVDGRRITVLRDFSRGGTVVAADAAVVALSPAPAMASLLCKTIRQRQRTRGDGQPLSAQDLARSVPAALV
jgi:hypothetical protein